jgi:hypothetical protein
VLRDEASPGRGGPGRACRTGSCGSRRSWRRGAKGRGGGAPALRCTPLVHPTIIVRDQPSTPRPAGRPWALRCVHNEVYRSVNSIVIQFTSLSCAVTLSSASRPSVLNKHQIQSLLCLRHRGHHCAQKHLAAAVLEARDGAVRRQARITARLPGPGPTARRYCTFDRNKIVDVGNFSFR